LHQLAALAERRRGSAAGAVRRHTARPAERGLRGPGRAGRIPRPPARDHAGARRARRAGCGAAVGRLGGADGGELPAGQRRGRVAERGPRTGCCAPTCAWPELEGCCALLALGLMLDDLAEGALELGGHGLLEEREQGLGRERAQPLDRLDQLVPALLGLTFALEGPPQLAEEQLGERARDRVA